MGPVALDAYCSLARQLGVGVGDYTAGNLLNRKFGLGCKDEIKSSTG